MYVVKKWSMANPLKQRTNNSSNQDSILNHNSNDNDKEVNMSQNIYQVLQREFPSQPNKWNYY